MRTRSCMTGVQAGALRLMLNSIALGVTSLAIQFQYTGKTIRGVKKLWGAVNFLLAICLALTVLVTKLAESHRRLDGKGHPLPPPSGIKAAAPTLFAVLGIPQAVTYSIPFALASMFSNSSVADQGLSLGVLNPAIFVPQMVISLASGPFDELFGGGNLPAFVLGAVAAAASGILALTMLPSTPPDASSSSAVVSADGSLRSNPLRQYNLLERGLPFYRRSLFHFRTITSVQCNHDKNVGVI